VRNEKSPKRDLLSKNTDAMTKRSDGERAERVITGTVIRVSRGKCETRERSVSLENAWNDPRAEIHRRDGGEGWRKKTGKNEGQKGFPKAPYGAL